MTPDERRAYQRVWREANKDKVAEHNRVWREANKDKVAEHNRVWREANKEKVAELNRAYKQSPEGKKVNTISKWRQSGLLHDDCDNLYSQYLEATHCNACKSEFKDSYYRCMDHNHDNGLFRQVLCRYCNTQDNWKKFIATAEDGFYLNIKSLFK